MIRRNQKLINFLNMLSDFLMIELSYFLSLFLRYEVMDGIMSVPVWERQYVLTALLAGAAIVFVYYLSGLYGSFRFRSLGQESILILMVNAGCTLVLVAVLFLFHVGEYSRLALALFWAIFSLFVILKRIVIRSFLRKVRALGYNKSHVIVVGNGHLAQQYIRDIANDPHIGITVDGYVSGVEKVGLGICLGSYEQLEDILKKYDPDDLVVALEPHEVRFMKRILAAADKEGVHINLIPFYNDYIPPHPSIDVVGRTKLINLRATPLDHLGWAMLKRVMDIVISLLGLLLTSPLLLLVAVGVKCSSQGPVFFKQDRIGKNKKLFRMIKFRSMRTDIDHTGWSIADDPRKTKFGSFIRKYSIDELPQLFNVLKGEMSLVGPRPELPKYVNRFKEEVPLYLVRQQVRPGMTGWAQVNGLRGDTSIENRVEYDIWYIENWSIWLDIKILFRTVFGGFINNEEMK